MMRNSGCRVFFLLLLMACVICALGMMPACGGSSGTGANSGGSANNNGGAGGGTGGGNNSGGGGNASIPSVQHVVIVVLENTDYSQVVGSASAPYINSLIPKGGLASNYYANVHPSIGNYFYMTTGQVITTDDAFQSMVSVDNVVREVGAASKTWKVYAENLPSVGYVGPDIPPFYLRRHNPLTFFSDVMEDPTALLHVAPYTALTADLAGGGLPNYTFIVPNAAHDAHSCSDGSLNCSIETRISNADTWLSNNLPAILNNQGFQQSGLLLLTFDESADDNTNGGGKVMTLILGTKVKAGYVGTGQYDHRSLLGLSMTALGAKIPDAGVGANQMTEFFQ